MQVCSATGWAAHRFSRPRSAGVWKSETATLSPAACPSSRDTASISAVLVMGGGLRLPTSPPLALLAVLLLEPSAA